MLKPRGFAVRAVGITLFLLWALNAVVGIGRQGSLRALLARTRSEEASINAKIVNLLDPAREEANYQPRGSLPFSNPTVASREPGMVLETGARWVYLPRLPLSGNDLAAATHEMRDRWLREIFAALRRARAGYIVLTDEDWLDDPAIRPLFRPIESLP